MARPILSVRDEMKGSSYAPFLSHLVPCTTPYPTVACCPYRCEGGDEGYPQGGSDAARSDLHHPPAVHVSVRDVRRAAATEERRSGRVLR